MLKLGVLSKLKLVPFNSLEGVVGTLLGGCNVFVAGFLLCCGDSVAWTLPLLLLKYSDGESMRDSSGKFGNRLELKVDCGEDAEGLI